MSDLEDSAVPPPSKKSRNSAETEIEPIKRSENEATADNGTTNNDADAAAVSDKNRRLLTERLRDVMMCIVCRDVPRPYANYQCSRGHIMCDECATRILANAVLHNEQAKCPHCRIPISWQQLSNNRNLVLQQALWELPTRCSQCDLELEHEMLEQHLAQECGRREVLCQYRCLGCDWRGCHDDRASHEAGCEFPNRSADDIVAALELMKRRETDYQNNLRLCYERLSSHRIYYIHLNMCFGRSGNRRMLLSRLFVAFENRWQLRIRMSPEQGSQMHRHLRYHLHLLSKPRCVLKVDHFVTMPTNKQLLPVLHTNFYHFRHQSSSYNPMPFVSEEAQFRLLATPLQCLCLWMFFHR